MASSEPGCCTSMNHNDESMAPVLNEGNSLAGRPQRTHNTAIFSPPSGVGPDFPYKMPFYR